MYVDAMVMLGLASLEILGGSVEPLKSDELFYIDIASTKNIGELWGTQRALWHAINYWVLNYDIGLNGLALKIVNIPLFALFVLYIFKIFDRRRHLWLLPLFLPYTLWVSTFNFRDIPILPCAGF